MGELRGEEQDGVQKRDEEKVSDAAADVGWKE